MGDMVADGSDVASGLLWFTFQQLAGLLVNLLVPFRELLNQRRRHPLDLKIPPPLIFDAVAESAQTPGQLVVIDVLDELLRRQHVVVLERLPAGLDRIERGVEDDTVRVQMRIEGARSVVTEHGGHDVARGSVRALAILADASGREGLQLTRVPPRPLVRAPRQCAGHGPPGRQWTPTWPART